MVYWYFFKHGTHKDRLTPAEMITIHLYINVRLLCKLCGIFNCQREAQIHDNISSIYCNYAWKIMKNYLTDLRISVRIFQSLYGIYLPSTKDIFAWYSMLKRMSYWKCKGNTRTGLLWGSKGMWPRLFITQSAKFLSAVFYLVWMILHRNGIEHSHIRAI